ncbi:MAG: tetratricopeptide repeat protein [Acidobacteriaceae bacterium]|nr:tetratricopeptide repeat protein [Acidobacteriaceae bacterium]
MSHLHFNSFRRLIFLTFSVTLLLGIVPLQAQTPAPGATKQQPDAKQATSPKAAAYYHYSLGHLYEELASTYGNRSDYVNKAIENFKLAMKEDPTTAFLVEDIAELYRVSGRLREAVEETQAALKTNPDDLNARRVLARIYTQQIGDAQSNHIDEGMVHRALEQYKFISEKDPKDTESLVMIGRLDRVVDNSVDAEAAFKKVLTIEPDNEDAVSGLASIYSDRGDAKTAAQLLEKLTEKSPSPRAFVNLANNYESMHQYALAVNAYKKAIDLDPTRTELKAALAQDQALAGQYDDALKTYADLAAANPQEAAPYLGMAQIYREQKKFDEARKSLNKAKELEPDNLEVRYNEVGLLDEEGKPAEAIAALKGILDSTAHKNYNPAEKSYRSKMLEQLGLMYRNNEQYDESIDAFRQIATLDPDLAARAEAQIIDTYRVARQFGKAQAEADSALKKYPDERTIREVRAQLLADQGKSEQAIAELKKLLDGKNDREVYLSMAEVYQKAKNFDGMNQALDEADKLSKTKEDKASVLFMRGAMYERQKKYDLAEKTFRSVLDMDPQNASALNYLGYMLADQGVRLPEAQDLIKRALKLEPNNYAFLDSLGWVYYRMDRLEEAEQELTRSVQIMSKDPTIHDHLGDVYFKQGKLKEAIGQWQSSVQELNSGAATDAEPDELAKVQKKLDGARVRLAREQGPKPRNP